MAVSGLTAVTSVAVLSRSNIDDGSVSASRDDGTVWCWGKRILGNGTNDDSPIPVQVTGLHDAVSVSGSSVPCALRATGLVECWGEATAYGLLGDGKRVTSYTPVEVDHIANLDAPAAIALSTGTNTGQTCAVIEDRTVMCWGITKPPGYAP